jgi:hypothetical protein
MFRHSDGVRFTSHQLARGIWKGYQMLLPLVIIDIVI